MTDKEFLWWIHERLVWVHREQELMDYMHRLRAIIQDLPQQKQTANVARVDTDAYVMRDAFRKSKVNPAPIAK